MSSTVPLFGIPVYTSSIEPLSNSIVDAIMHSKFIRMENSNGYITEDVNLLEQSQYLELKEKILNVVREYVYKILSIRDDKLFYITTSWAVKFETGGWGQKHMHGNSLFSGVVYLKTPKDESGKISFHKDNRYSNICSPTLQLDYINYNIYNSDVWSISPKENDVIIFPSNLTHSVEINKSEEDRISVAFNVFVKGNFGIYESFLTIG